MTAKVLAVSMGDPAGVGPEIILRSFAARSASHKKGKEKEAALPRFFVCGGADFLRRLAAQRGISARVQTITHPRQAAEVFADALPVLPLAEAFTARAGEPDESGQRAALASLEQAYGFAAGGEVDGLVTAPINKHAIRAAGFRDSGHTGYLARRTGKTALMMLAAPGLRVALATGHIPLAQVPAALNQDLLIECLAILTRALKRDFALSAPRLAVAACNPHGGDGGLLGSEERTIIAPAIEAARAAGTPADGPYPADSLFTPALRARYDAVLCMYHDQALIALKTLDFAHGVNITLGLPLVRTSPDHGTAYELAAAGGADPTPMMEALRQAAAIAARRNKSRC